MYAKILIATDGSEVSDRGVEQGLALAKALGSSVTIVTATEPVATVGGGLVGEAVEALPELIEVTEEAADKRLAAAEARARELGVPVTALRVDQSFAAEAIVAAADKVGADLIVMATHGRHGLERLLFGSQTAGVLSHSTIPVLVVR